MDIDYDAFGAPYDEFADLNMGEEKKTRRITLDLRKVDYKQTRDALVTEVVALANSQTSESGVELDTTATYKRLQSTDETRHSLHGYDQSSRLGASRTLTGCLRQTRLI
jgi:hypothetical protein